MPEFLQTEGVDAVLDNLTKRARVTAVTTSPYVMAPADEKTGSREPPIDAGAGSVRLLDRPILGKRELFIQTAPSFTPDVRLYEGLQYRPAAPTQLTKEHGAVVGQFIQAAHARGLKVYLQIQAAIPPGYRVQFGGASAEDQPLLPDGSVPSKRLANNGTLASTEMLKYTQALIRDLCIAYPKIDGIRLDWPEYPPYFLSAAYLDYSAPARKAADRMGFNFARMQKAAAQRWKQLHGQLTNRELEKWCAGKLGNAGLLSALFDSPDLKESLRFKSALVSEFLAGCRTALHREGGPNKVLIPNAFPPPFSTISGMDFQKAAPHSDAYNVKLYTMHWPMILRFYADELMAANPGLDDRLLVQGLNRILDLAEPGTMKTLADCRYPEPNEPHPVSLAAQKRKIVAAQKIAGKVPVYALAHGYGPVDDFAARFQAAYEASGGRVWVNRYGYLSDSKLDRMGEISR